MNTIGMLGTQRLQDHRCSVITYVCCELLPINTIALLLKGGPPANEFYGIVNRWGCFYFSSLPSLPAPFPSPPFPSPIPFLPLLSPHFPSEVGPLKPATGLGERCKLP